jgi:hypothetical protein
MNKNKIISSVFIVAAFWFVIAWAIVGNGTENGGFYPPFGLMIQSTAAIIPYIFLGTLLGLIAPFILRYIKLFFAVNSVYNKKVYVDDLWLSIGSMPVSRHSLYNRSENKPTALDDEPLANWFHKQNISEPYRALYIAVARILRENNYMPASHIKGGHGDANLEQHSINVLMAGINLLNNKWNMKTTIFGEKRPLPQGIINSEYGEYQSSTDPYTFTPETDPLALLCCFAHDIGKLESYAFNKSTGQVRLVRTTHDLEGGRIIASLPEFKRLNPDEQRTLSLAMSYYHHPRSMPANVGDRPRALTLFMRDADLSAGLAEGESEEMMLQSYAEDDGVFVDAAYVKRPQSLYYTMGANRVCPPKEVQAAAYQVFTYTLRKIFDNKKDDGTVKASSAVVLYNGIMYINDIALRTEAAQQALSRKDNLIDTTTSGQGNTSEFTKAVMWSLYRIGALIHTDDNGIRSPNQALLRITIGTKRNEGMYIGFKPKIVFPEFEADDLPPSSKTAVTHEFVISKCITFIPNIDNKPDRFVTRQEIELDGITSEEDPTTDTAATNAIAVSEASRQAPESNPENEGDDIAQSAIENQMDTSEIDALIFAKNSKETPIHDAAIPSISPVKDVNTTTQKDDKTKKSDGETDPTRSDQANTATTDSKDGGSVNSIALDKKDGEAYVDVAENPEAELEAEPAVEAAVVISETAMATPVEKLTKKKPKSDMPTKEPAVIPAKPQVAVSVKPVVLADTVAYFLKMTAAKTEFAYRHKIAKYAYKITRPDAITYFEHHGNDVVFEGENKGVLIKFFDATSILKAVSEADEKKPKTAKNVTIVNGNYVVRADVIKKLLSIDMGVNIVNGKWEKDSLLIPASESAPVEDTTPPSPTETATLQAVESPLSQPDAATAEMPSVHDMTTCADDEDIDSYSDSVSDDWQGDVVVENTENQAEITLSVAEMNALTLFNYLDQWKLIEDWADAYSYLSLLVVTESTSIKADTASLFEITEEFANRGETLINAAARISERIIHAPVEDMPDLKAGWYLLLEQK